MDNFISYDGLPIKAGGAHSISSKDLNGIFETVLDFIKNFTNSNRPATLDLLLERPNARKTLKYSVLFGMPKLSFTSPKSVFWSIPLQKVNKAFELIHEDTNLLLVAKWHFKFVDLESKELLPKQNEIPTIDGRLHNSQVHLRLAKNKSTIAVWLTFPFSDFDGRNLIYINAVKNALPFKFSEKHWRIWKHSEKRQLGCQTFQSERQLTFPFAQAGQTLVLRLLFFVWLLFF